MIEHSLSRILLNDRAFIIKDILSELRENMSRRKKKKDCSVFDTLAPLIFLKEKHGQVS